jgi:hypothetical protein
MPRIKITGLPKAKLGKSQVGGQCPLGSTWDAAQQKCVPNTQEAQSPTVKFTSNLNDMAPPEDVVQEQKKDAADMQNKQNFMNKPTNEMATASWAQDFNNKFKINTPQYDANKKYDSKGNIIQPKKKTDFWGGLHNFNQGIDNAFSIAQPVLSILDNRKKQKEYDAWAAQSMQPHNMYAVDTNTNRGDYDINDGMFNDMGYKSKGTQANPISAQQNFVRYGGPMQYAADGINVLPGDRVVQPSFLPDINIPEGVRQQTQQAQQAPSQPSDKNIADIIAAKESGGDYQALPRKKDGTLASSAVGKYQFLWNSNKDWIEKVTGVNSKTGFMNNPEAQEKAFKYWDETVLTPNAQKIKNELGVQVPINNIKYAIHFAGPTGAYRYFKTGEETTDAFGSNVAKYAEINTNNDLTGFAAQHGFDVTSTTGGKHNVGSKHYQGKAIDVRTRDKSPEEIAAFIAKAQQQGFRVLDERQRPAGQAVWGGPHLHLEKSKFGGQNSKNMKIRIIGTPDNPQMAGGGQPPYSGQSNYGLYIGQRNLYSTMANHPYEDVKKSVTEEKNPKAPYVLEAEGGETILRPDGTHMNITGKRHTQGGEKLTAEQAPEGSFIYSDTKKMTIKNIEILKEFGLSPRKQGYTPAEIAKKYDTNKYRAILSDSNTDDLQKNTAKRMLDVYEKKLAELAMVQEGMKGFPNGIPDVAKSLFPQEEQTEGQSPQQGGQEEMIEGPQGQESSEQEQQEQPPMQMYGGGLKQYQGTTGGSTVTSPINETDLKNKYPWFKPWTSSKTVAGRTSPKGAQTTYRPDVGSIYDNLDRWVGQAKKEGININNIKDLQRFVYNKNPKAVAEMWKLYGHTGASPREDVEGFSEGIAGDRLRYMLEQPNEGGDIPSEKKPPLIRSVPGRVKSVVQVPQQEEDIQPQDGSFTKKIIPGDFTSTKQNIPSAWAQQDINNLGAAGLNLALMKKYHMASRTIQPTLPEFIPQDWRGYAASLQSGANSAADQMGAYQPGQGMASNLSFLAGQQGENLGKYISGVDQYNAAGATAMDEKRANTLNQFTQYNAGKRDYDMDYENTADSKYKAALAHGFDRITAATNQGLTNSANLYNMNVSQDPDYYINPRTGKMQFNDKEAYERYMARMKGGYQDPNANSEAMFQTAEKYRRAGYDPATAARMAGFGTNAGRSTNITYPNSPGKNKYSTTSSIPSYPYAPSMATNPYNNTAGINYNTYPAYSTYPEQD